MKKTLFLLALSFVVQNALYSQEKSEITTDSLSKVVANLGKEISKLKHLKISGYVQPQFQYIDSAGAPSVAGGDFVNGTNAYYSRFMMRRARFKFTYTYNNVLVMVNTDATEKGLNMRETYAKITDPWLNMFSVTAGLLQVQFGFELTQSSSERETPERVRYNQTLFPTERDLGAFGSLVFPKSSKLHGLKIDAAVMNGAAGVAPEFDSHKDFTGRIQYSKTTKNKKINFAIGASTYYGGYRTGKVKDYVMKKNTAGDNAFDFASDTGNYNRVARRIYYGADIQTSIEWAIGTTALRAEYILGENPGTSSTNKSPATAPTSSLYHRNFDGAYFYFIQDIGKSKFQIVGKYDWFDPNTKISGKQIGKAGTNTNVGDIRFDTYGVGVTYKINSYAKIVLYYDMVKNESTEINAYKGDIKDNVFTCRIQIKY